MRKAKLKIHFNKNYRFLWIPYFIKRDLMWKDKFETPRCEHVPYFMFEWLWFSIYGHWEDDQYWTQWLWINKYHNGDIDVAKEEWGWTDMKTGKSTWKEYK